jgi:dTMP kinase
MKLEDDTPDLGEIVRPYPKVPPIRHILRKEHPVCGRMVVFEGPDGAGKSTHIEMLRAPLERLGSKVLVAGFSPLIRHAWLRSKWENSDPYTMALIYAAGLTDTVNRLVLPALESGTVVLMDRYVYSIMARSIVRGCQVAWVHELVSHLPIPDLVIHLQVPAHVSLSRKQVTPPGPGYWESGADVFGDDQLRLSEDLGVFSQCFLQYQQAVQDETSALLTEVTTLAVDADRDADVVHQTIWDAIETLRETP